MRRKIFFQNFKWQYYVHVIEIILATINSYNLGEIFWFKKSQKNMRLSIRENKKSIKKV